MSRSLAFDLGAGSGRALVGRLDAPLAGIGVDAWGRDYGLLDERGDLFELPYHYRDHRTDGVMDEVTAQPGRRRVCETTRVLFPPFNTLFQLCRCDARTTSSLDPATHGLTLPNLLNRRLTGRIACEYTNATTTQCVDARSMKAACAARRACPEHRRPVAAACLPSRLGRRSARGSLRRARIGCGRGPGVRRRSP